MRTLCPKSFRTCGRSHNRCVHLIAVEYLEARQIEIDCATDEDVSLSALAQPAPEPQYVRRNYLKDDAPAFGAAQPPFLNQCGHAHDHAIGMCPQQVH